LCRNCLLQQVIEGKIKDWIEVTGRRVRIRREPLDDRILSSEGGSSRPHYVESWLWRGFGPVVRKTAE
jgi:hypothetical protein